MKQAGGFADPGGREPGRNGRDEEHGADNGTGPIEIASRHHEQLRRDALRSILRSEGAGRRPWGCCRYAPQHAAGVALEAVDVGQDLDTDPRQARPARKASTCRGGLGLVVLVSVLGF